MSRGRRSAFALPLVLCCFAGCLPQSGPVDPTPRPRSTAAPSGGSTAASSSGQSETLKRIYGIVAEQMQIDGSELTPDTSLADLKMDELDIYETVMWTEEAFGVRISDEEGEPTLTSGATLADLANLVDAARGARNAGE